MISASVIPHCRDVCFVCVCVRACVSVCVCVRERQRERENTYCLKYSWPLTRYFSWPQQHVKHYINVALVHTHVVGLEEEGKIGLGWAIVFFTPVCGWDLFKHNKSFNESLTSVVKLTAKGFLTSSIPDKPNIKKTTKKTHDWWDNWRWSVPLWWCGKSKKYWSAFWRKKLANLCTNVACIAAFKWQHRQCFFFFF